MWTKTANISATPTLGGPPHTQYKETLCFEPKALILWETIGGANSPLEFRYSFCSTTSNEVRKRISVDFFTSTYTNAIVNDLASGIQLVSFDPDGFTLQFPDTATHNLSYTAIGGPNLEAYVGAFTMPTGSTADIVTTGLGFQPDFLLSMVGVTNAGSDAIGSMGMASGPSNQGSAGMYRYLFGTLQKDFWDDRIVSMIAYADLQSFDADGFTVGVTLAPPNNMDVYYLALHDPTANFFVGNDTQKTSTGTKATTGVGFQPGAGWFIHSGRTATTGYDTSDPAALVFSATDGHAENALGGYSYGGGGDHTYSNDDLLPFLDTGGTVLAKAHLGSLDADGFTLDWVTADAIGRRFLYAMFETENPQNDACPQDRIVSLYVTFPE